MKLLLPFVFFCCLSPILLAQSVHGVWKTVDDEDGQAKSHINLYEENGKTYGQVIKLLPGADPTICKKCDGDLKNKPIEGMIVLYDMEPDGDAYTGGDILDPANGKTYSCKIELDGDDKLSVRGYIGHPLLGRTQTWYRVNTQ